MSGALFGVTFTMTVFLPKQCAAGVLSRRDGDQEIFAVIDKISTTGRFPRIFQKYIFGPGGPYCDCLSAYEGDMNRLLQVRPYFFIPIVSPEEIFEDFDLIRLLPHFLEKYGTCAFVKAPGVLTLGAYYTFFKLLVQSVSKSLVFAKSRLIHGLMDSGILVCDSGSVRLGNIRTLSRHLREDPSFLSLQESLNFFLAVSSVLIAPHEKEIILLRDVQSNLIRHRVAASPSAKTLRMPYILDHVPENASSAPPRPRFMTREDRDGEILKTIEKICSVGELPRFLRTYIFGSAFQDQPDDISFCRLELSSCVQYREPRQIPIVSLPVTVSDLCFIKALPHFCENYEKQCFLEIKGSLSPQDYWFMLLFFQAVRESLFVARDRLESALRTEGVWVKVGESEVLNSPSELQMIVGRNWDVHDTFQNLQDYLRVMNVLMVSLERDCALLSETSRVLGSLYEDLRSPTKSINIPCGWKKEMCFADEISLGLLR
jgi:hypothetical protein